MATKPTLSREYVFIPVSNINFAIADLNLHRVAFTNAGIEPTDPDWSDAIKVDSAHALYQASIGESIALLVGPLRGDTGVTTKDLAAQDWQVWCEFSTAASSERVVRVAGTLTVTATG